MRAEEASKCVRTTAQRAGVRGKTRPLAEAPDMPWGLRHETGRQRNVRGTVKGVRSYTSTKRTRQVETGGQQGESGGVECDGSNQIVEIASKRLG